jgi:hypothetical protein
VTAEAQLQCSFFTIFSARSAPPRDIAFTNASSATQSIPRPLVNAASSRKWNSVNAAAPVHASSVAARLVMDHQLHTAIKTG